MSQPNPRLFTFAAGPSGAWRILSSKPYIGDGLPAASHLDILTGSASPANAAWVLHGATSNHRYTTAAERDQLLAKQSPLGRPEATHAALIPIRKNAAWWALSQDQRRAIFEETSHHTTIGLKYLPPIARRLHHCRDLSFPEPFDFLTLFDYAEEHAPAFEELVRLLRATEEWKYVDREVDVRLVCV